MKKEGRVLSWRRELYTSHIYSMSHFYHTFSTRIALSFCYSADYCQLEKIFYLQLFYVEFYFLFEWNCIISPYLKQHDNFICLLCSSLSCCSHIMFTYRYIHIYTYIWWISIFTSSYILCFICIIMCKSLYCNILCIQCNMDLINFL